MKLSIFSWQGKINRTMNILEKAAEKYQRTWDGQMNVFIDFNTGRHCPTY